LLLLLLADLHLDAPFRWAGPRAGRLRRQRLRAVLKRAVTLAQERQVGAIRCAGDLYEQERFTPDTLAFLSSAFADAAPIRVVGAPGDHDWYGPGSLWARAEFSSNVHV
jgi:DNA repair exonuclease SbcCD nuclease subunit